MPGWRLHKLVDEIFFGKSYAKIHRMMDGPVVYLGKNHRILFHDALTASLLARESYPGDPNAVAAANLHIFLDDLCSRNPAFKQCLEQMAILQSKKKITRKRRKRAPKDPSTIFFRKLEEAKRLTQALQQR